MFRNYRDDMYPKDVKRLGRTLQSKTLEELRKLRKVTLKIKLSAIGMQNLHGSLKDLCSIWKRFVSFQAFGFQPLHVLGGISIRESKSFSYSNAV